MCEIELLVFINQRDQEHDKYTKTASSEQQ